jgi:hypothetical protein
VADPTNGLGGLIPVWCDNAIVAEGEVAPARGVSVVIHEPSKDAVLRSPRDSRAWQLLIIRDLVSFVVVGLIAGLLFGVLGAAIVVIGLALIAGIIWLSVSYRKAIRRDLYADSAGDWMSRVAFYERPFDEAGLRGAKHFETQHGSYNNPPQVRLAVTAEGLLVGPSGHSGDPMKLPFAEIESVELIPGTKKWMIVVTPPIASRLGRVVLTTTDGRTARLSGILPEDLEAALVRQGATTTTI